MKPVQVSTDVSTSREEVFEFLDVMANHEQFTNHILKDWEYEGPRAGIGSKARVKVKAGGRTDEVEIEVVSATRPERIVERNIGAKGRRVATGTYMLEEIPGGGTRIVFEYAWQQTPLSERLTAAMVRSILRRANERAMERLAQTLAGRTPASAGPRA